MCTDVPTWQYLNYSSSSDKAAIARAYAAACMHIRFVTEIHHEQLEGTRYFLHGHPRYATSWQLHCMAAANGME